MNRRTTGATNGPTIVAVGDSEAAERLAGAVPADIRPQIEVGAEAVPVAPEEGVVRRDADVPAVEEGAVGVGRQLVAVGLAHEGVADGREEEWAAIRGPVQLRDRAPLVADVVEGLGADGGPERPGGGPHAGEGPHGRRRRHRARRRRFRGKAGSSSS